MIKPLIEKLSLVLIKITPREMINKYESQIAAAGSPYGFGVNEWLFLQGMIIFIFLPLILIYCLSSSVALQRTVILAGLEISIGLTLHNLILNSKIQKRRRAIIITLPDILELLTASVETGLGFDVALSKAVEKIPGVLSKEFDRVIQEIKMGKPRKDALKSMSERFNVVDLTTFIASVIQADQLGVSISNVLRIQSEQMRMRRRQRAQEKAMKAPVKMLLPMIIFPTIFTVLLGPSIIKRMDIFAK